MGGFEDDHISTGLGCTLSIIGSLSIIISYFMLPSQGRELLAWLSLADLIAAINYIVPVILNIEPSDYSNYCKSQAIIGIFFPVASFLWTDCIAWYLYKVVIQHIETDGYSAYQNHRSIFPMFHLICWGIPAIMCTLVGSMNKAGQYTHVDDDHPTTPINTGGWCWIKSQNQEDLIIWEIIGGKIVEWPSAFIFLPGIYAMIVHKISHLTTSETQAKFGGFTRRLVLVPVIFFLTRMWGSVLAIQTMINPDKGGTEWVTWISAFFDPSQGFFNALLFVVFAADVREAYRKYFLSWCDRNVSMTEKPTNIDGSTVPGVSPSPFSVNHDDPPVQRPHGYDRLLLDAD